MLTTRFFPPLFAVFLLGATLFPVFLPSECLGDWPRWRGASGTGDWSPEGFPGEITEEAAESLWKRRIGAGYSGVTVAAGRVFTMDYTKAPEERERIACFDADTGKPLWEHAYPVRYEGLEYGSGPRASVTIDGELVYALGAVGHAYCLEAATGAVRWGIDTVQSLGAQVPTWGFAASPFIWNHSVILHVAARPDGCYLALDKATGRELWRSVSDPAGYCTPHLIRRDGVEQLLCWTPEHIHGIAPADGTVHWSIPYKVQYGVSIASPIHAGGTALVSGYWHGTRAIALGQGPGNARLLWSEESAICGLMSQPLEKDGFVYLLDKAKGLLCFELATGKVLWNDAHRLTPQDRNPQASLVWADRARNLVCALNANGELVIAECTPQRMTEKSRMQLLGKTWAHPAFSGNRVYARNDRELVAIRLWPDPPQAGAGRASVHMRHAAFDTFSNHDAEDHFPGRGNRPEIVMKTCGDSSPAGALLQCQEIAAGH